MERIEVLWICTCMDKPVGIVKAWDGIEDCWKFYIGVGEGRDIDEDIKLIMDWGQKFYSLDFIGEFGGLWKWIPVSEKKPPVGQEVLTVRPSGNGAYVETDKLFSDGYFLFRDTTYWMPLPPMPGEV